MELRSDKRELLIALFVSALVLSNLLSVKIITIEWISVPGGIVCYAVTFLMADVIGELYGQETSKSAVRCGFVAQIMCSGLALLTCILPSTDAETNVAVNTVFGFSVWSMSASLIAYAVAQSIDVTLFHRIRQALIKRGKPYKWVWNNISTIISQVADALIYVGIAFGMGQRLPITTIMGMVVSQIIVKVALAIADTPLFYLLTREKGGGHGKEKTHKR